MTYQGRVKDGVVVFEGAQRPPDGTIVRVDEVATDAAEPVGEALDKLAGKAQGLPTDLAASHDRPRANRHRIFLEYEP